jgi:hypothetical protein
MIKANQLAGLTYLLSKSGFRKYVSGAFRTVAIFANSL